MSNNRSLYNAEATLAARAGYKKQCSEHQEAFSAP